MTSAAGCIIKARGQRRDQSAPSWRRVAVGFALACSLTVSAGPSGTMHLSQLLACTLLLTLLSLRPSEAKPGAPPKGPRSPPGEEVAEPQAAGGGQKKGDKSPGGGGANLKGDRSRLLRDLRVDTKSRAAWARLLHEHPNARKYKGGNKKGLSKGCFGLKLDRIGSMSGLGC
ncbi:C-type natriuretic peptide [Fukomys damarensis]|uniref:C-type natriuretic peptide n=2 Tax=Fukomys damarensis TaxID=885580 RepID=A0A091DII5_FUKDA|nr:C-type natriuretic peptide [Fukomys damarensis]